MSETERTTILTGTWKNGQVVLDGPPGWPEGCRVVVMRELNAEPAATTGDEQADDPESIAQWLAAFDSILPVELTAEEEAEWRAALAAQKAFEISKFEERARRIESLFP
jgi:hypothetical protein